MRMGKKYFEQKKWLRGISILTARQTRFKST
jgi:hypothetical protein